MVNCRLKRNRNKASCRKRLAKPPVKIGWKCKTDEGAIFCEKRIGTRLRGDSMFPKKIHLTGMDCEDFGLGRLKCTFRRKRY